MTKTIKLSQAHLIPNFFKDLQEKYKNRNVELTISESEEVLLDEKMFWEILGLLDWTQVEDVDITSPAVVRLAELPIRDIYLFQDTLSEKLHRLDAKKYALHIGEDSWQKDKYFSVDNFLYARCAVVANGKKIYEEILQDPAKMPKDLTYEPVLSLAADAYKLKTGKTFDYTGHFNYETYGNEEGWITEEN